MKTIKDSVHDHITVEGVARDLLDTPAVQRLRYVRQLGTVHLVYPSANHTRFEHSLGVYHLARRALDELGVAGETAEHVTAAAILHDIGHAPFSHNIEELIARRTGRYHDDVGDLLEGNDVGAVLDEHELSADRIADLIAGEGRYGQLISGELDVDRLDYLVRDAHHTGVPYGTIDPARLIRELRYVDGDLVLGPGNVESAESVLLARALMNPTVYNHHVARISKTMLRRAVEDYLDAADVSATTVRRLDDHTLAVRLRQHEASAELGRRLYERDLYKRAAWAEYDDVPERVHKASHAELRGFEGELAEIAGLGESEVVIDRPTEPTMRETDARVMVGSTVYPLEERSPLVRALRTIQRDQWRFGIYTPLEHVDAVAQAADEVLDLPPTAGDFEDEHVGTYARLDDFGRTSD